MRSYVTSAGSALLVAVALLSATVPSTAAAKRSSAEQLYREGTAAFDAGRYREAIALYERALARVDHPNTLYAIGEAYRRLGELRRSHEYYSRYAERLPAAEREAFAAKLDGLRSGAPAPLVVRTTPAGATVFVNGVRRGSTGGDGRLELRVAGGRHRVTAELAGHDAVAREIIAEFAEPVRLDLSLRPRRAADRPPAVPPAVVPPTTPPAAPPAPPRETAPRVVLEPFVGLLAGVRFASYGNPALDASPAADALLHGGVLWRGARFGGYVSLALSVVPIIDDVTKDTAAMIAVLAGGGLRYRPWPEVWLDLGVTVGPCVLAEIAPSSFLLRQGGGAGRTLVGLALRPTFGVGWDVTRWLALTLYPISLIYAPRVGGFDELAAGIEHLLRVQVLVGLSWRGG